MSEVIIPTFEAHPAPPEPSKGEREYVAAPVIGARQRCQKKAERRARPEGHQRDQATETDDERRRAPSSGR